MADSKPDSRGKRRRFPAPNQAGAETPPYNGLSSRRPGRGANLVAFMSPASEPQVSVITIVRNQARWIDGCAGSVLQTGGTELEWVVVDNGSEDGTLDRLHDWSRRDPRVRLHRAGENLMQSDGIPRALERARGRYASFLDGDDLVLPGRLERSVGWLAQSQQRVAVYGEARFVDEHDRPLEPWFIARDAAALRRMAEFTMPAIHSTGTWRIDALRAACDRLPERTMVYDYWLLIRALELGEVGWLPEPLCAYRVHPASESHRHRLRSFAVGTAVALIAAGRGAGRTVDTAMAMRWANEVTQSGRSTAEVEAAAARFALRLGLPRHALYYARRAVRAGQWRGVGPVVHALWCSRGRKDVWPVLRGGLLAAANIDGRGRSVSG